MARETYLEAIAAAMFAGRLGGKPNVRELAEAAQAAPPAQQPARAIDLLLDGLATRFTLGYAAGVPPLRKAPHAPERPNFMYPLDWSSSAAAIPSSVNDADADLRHPRLVEQRAREAGVV